MYLKNINLKRLKQLVSPLLILLVLVWAVAVVSCEVMMGNDLEKPPGGDVTEDTIFSSRTQVETFLTSIYQMGIHSNLGYASSISCKMKKSISLKLARGIFKLSSNCKRSRIIGIPP